MSALTSSTNTEILSQLSAMHELEEHIVSVAQKPCGVSLDGQWLFAPYVLYAQDGQLRDRPLTVADATDPRIIPFIESIGGQK